MRVLILSLIVIVLSGCQVGYSKVTDTRTGRVYAAKGLVEPFWPGDPVKFQDDITNTRVRLEAYIVQFPISRAAYEDLVGKRK